MRHRPTPNPLRSHSIALMSQCLSRRSYPAPSLPPEATRTSRLSVHAVYDSDRTETVKRKKKIAFEEQFEREYFEKLPTIDAMKLINFLTKPSGNYESPFTGSFSSESEWGQETASFQGVLRFRADRIRKDE